MKTKKLLVVLDPQKPEQGSSDFLIVVLEGQEPRLIGLKSHKRFTSGMVVYIGKERGANDLFARLVDTGRRIENVQQAMGTIESYIQMLQDFRIGNILTVQRDATCGFRLIKLADFRPSAGTSSKLP